MGLKTKNTFSKAALLSFASAIALATPTIAVAQTGSEAVRPFSSAPQALGDTLVAIGDYFGADVIVSNDLVRGLRSPAVSGATSAQDALEQALIGSDLAVSRSSGGAFVVSQNTAAASPAAVNVADEIIVTGRFQDSLIDRLPVTIQELPFTLDTLDRSEIDNRGFVRPIDVIDTLPNVQIAVDQVSFGTPSFLVRGFVSPVLVNNRVVTSLRGSGQRDDSFVERYEVLKGPASIALGPVNGGGVINTVTKSPQQEDFNRIRLSAGNYGTMIGEFDVNQAEFLGSDKVSFRLSGALRDFDFRVDEGDREEFAIRPVILFDVGQATSARLSVGYREVESQPNPSFPLFNDGTVPPQFDNSTFFGVVNGFGKFEDTFIDAQVTHDFLDNLKLTVRGSRQITNIDYQDRNGLYNYNQDEGLSGASRLNPVGYAYAVTGINESDTDFVDAQLLYSFDAFDREHSIVIGGSYVNTDLVSFTNFAERLGPFPFDEVDNVRVGVTDNQPSVDPTFIRSNELYSVYAEAVLRPLDGLSIIGGVRYDDFEEAVSRPPGLPVVSQSDAITGRIGLSYEITQSVSGFVSYASAFTPQSGLLRSGNPVGPERSRNFEVGIKGSFFSDMLSADLTLFSTRRSNVAVEDPDFIIGPEDFVIPIGEQTNRGIEFTGRFDTGTGFEVDLTYGHLDQKVNENVDGGRPVAFPSNQLSVFGSYEVQDGVLSGLSIGGGLRYFSSRASLNPGVRFPSATVGDARISYAFSEDTSLALNVLNVTDNLYLEAASGRNGSLSGQQNFGAPRTFVLTFRTSL
ncbi:MAG: TonB-dependent receptor [Pseudomonadota bacterium]